MIPKESYVAAVKYGWSDKKALWGVLSMRIHQMQVDKILMEIFERERTLLLGNLSDGEKEMMAVILYDLNIELKELGYEVPKH